MACERNMRGVEFTMQLIGNYLSPYVRRVAVSLNLLEIPFELDQVFVFNTPDAVRAHNPIVRIPTLIADDDDEPLIESYAILDWLDEQAGPERALTPASGAGRRRVMKVAAMALAATEKAQWAIYELRFHPKEKVHPPWMAHNEAQVLSGLGWLDGLAGEAGWLAGTPAISQADVTAAVGFTFIQFARPGLAIAEKYPALAAFVARCEALDAFAAAPLPEPPG